jgi:FkbM family methyltransferase
MGVDCLILRLRQSDPVVYKNVKLHCLKMEKIKMISYESTYDANGFIELSVISGNIQSDTKFIADLSMNSDGYISFLRDDGSVPLSVSWECENNTIIVACFENNEWATFGVFDECAAKAGELTELEIIKRDGFIGIKLDKMDYYSVIGRFEGVSRVGGSGGVRRFEVRTQQNNPSLSEKIVKSIAKGKANFKLCNNLIFDFGLHNGNDADYYLKKGYKVVSVDASPILSEQAVKRFSEEIESGDLVIVNVGVSDSGKRMPFFISLVNSEQSSFDEQFARRLGPVRKVEVETARPIDLFGEFGVPYYVKIDIEGYDLVVLDDVMALPIKPKYLSFECGPIGWSNYLPLLKDSGYGRFKVVNQLNVKGASAPVPAKEGKTIEYKFLSSSSGVFGEDTAGEWVSAKKVEEEFKLIIEDIESEKYPITPWFDIHAAR